MKNQHLDDAFKIYHRAFHSPRPEPFVVALPDFVWKLFIVIMGAFIPISLAILTDLAGLVASGLIIAFEIAICASFRGTLIEWGVVFAIGFVLIAVALPAVTPDHSYRNRMMRSATSSPSTPNPVPAPP